MSLTLSQNATSIAPNGNTPFQAVGGTPPYTYSVVGGGAGGTIDASGGLYTAPNVTGTDTVQVIDSLSATAQATIYIRNVVELVADIIQTCMGLSSTQVYLWNQKVDFPKDSNPYVVVRVLAGKPFGNTNSFNTSTFDSIQSVNMQATLQIEIFSRGPAARDRKEEIIMAFNSTYANQQMELNAFQIAQIPSNFVDLSQADGPAILYQFNISVNVLYFVTKSTAVPYYSSFGTPTVVTNP